MGVTIAYSSLMINAFLLSSLTDLCIHQVYDGGGGRGGLLGTVSGRSSSNKRQKVYSLLCVKKTLKIYKTPCASEYKPPSL
jgi:hypothetical protein